jgi:hypothetical protein
MSFWEFDQWFNFFEGCLWLVFAAMMAFRSRRMASHRPLALVAAAAFFFFGVSDFIETETRAWYEPIALAAMKGLCLGVLAGCLVLLLRCRKKAARLRSSEAEGG